MDCAVELAGLESIVGAISENVSALVDIETQSTYGVIAGGGCEDICIGFFGKNYLIEIKSPGRAKQLTSAEAEFIADWRGQVDVATCLDEILQIIGAVD